MTLYTAAEIYNRLKMVGLIDSKNRMQLDTGAVLVKPTNSNKLPPNVMMTKELL